MAKTKAISLAGMGRGGCSPDGQEITFTLTAHGGRQYTFNIPFEALSEIFTALLGLAEKARAARAPQADPQVGDAFVFQRVAHHRVDATSAGEIVISLTCGSLLPQRFGVDPQRALELCGDLTRMRDQVMRSAH